MSFGYSAGEIVGLTQIAWKIVQNARKACGEHNGLTREVSSLHAILLRLQSTASAADPALNPHNDISTQALRHAIENLRNVLQDLDEILEKYNGLSESQRATTRLWSKIRFGNGPMLDLGKIRMKIVTSMAVITAHLNVGMSEDIRKMQGSLEKIAGKMAGGEEGTVLTNYDGDDRAAWRELRRELRREGFEDSFVRERKESIIDYIREIGKRGFFDVDETTIASSSRDPDAGLGFGEPSAKTVVPESQEIYDSFDEESLSDDDEERAHYLSDSSDDDSDLDEGYLSVESEHGEPWPTSVPQRKVKDQTMTEGIYRQCINCENRQLKSEPKTFLKLRRCQHYWCPRCLNKAFLKSLTSPADMPPRCCGPKHLPLHSIAYLFNTGFKKLWIEKYFEFTVTNPAYCPHDDCGALIYPRQTMVKRGDPYFSGRSLFRADDPRKQVFPYAAIKRIWSCKECRRKMCPTCNAEAHPSNQQCVSEKDRARNARFYARAGAATDHDYVAEIKAQNKSWEDKIPPPKQNFKKTGAGSSGVGKNFPGRALISWLAAYPRSKK